MVVRELLNNRILILSLGSLILAQILKILTHLIVFRELRLERAFDSGGMPSSHSSFVMTLSISIGFKYGFDSVYFSIAIVHGLIVMYDASGVRMAVGKQAKILNEIRALVEMLSSTDIEPDEKLKELVGHTKIEVLMGAILGIVVGILGCNYYM